MKHRFIAVSLILLTFMLALHNLQFEPLPWFDEGWVLSLARNWLVLGHYGHLLQGEPVSSTILNTGFPAVIPVALSFRFLGIGIWQGRWPSVLFLIGTFALTYNLAQQLYGRRIAVWTLVILLLLPIYPDLHPIFMGRQALGEIPAVFYLLAGYSLLFASWQKKNGVILIAPIFFSLALQTKPQILPFFAASLILSILWLALQRQWHEIRPLAISLTVALILSTIFSRLAEYFLLPLQGSSSTSGDPYAMVKKLDVLLTYVAVLDPVFRLNQLLHSFISLMGFSVWVGIIYVGIYQIRHLRRDGSSNFKSTWVLVLWTFVLSWFCWYFLLSIGFVRYLFPAFLIGSIFTAKALDDLALGFNFVAVFKGVARNIHYRTVNAEGLKLFLTMMLIVISATITLMVLSTLYRSSPVDNYANVLRFLNNETPPDALIETYDSELFLFLERDYHYPPDSLQHILNQKVYLGKEVTVDYDPTSLGINYVVIGETKTWPIYDELLASGAFELVYENANYRVLRNTER